MPPASDPVSGSAKRALRPRFQEDGWCKLPLAVVHSRRIEGPQPAEGSRVRALIRVAIKGGGPSFHYAPFTFYFGTTVPYGDLGIESTPSQRRDVVLIAPGPPAPMPPPPPARTPHHATH